MYTKQTEIFILECCCLRSTQDTSLAARGLWQLMLIAPEVRTELKSWAVWGGLADTAWPGAVLLSDLQHCPWGQRVLGTAYTNLCAWSILRRGMTLPAPLTLPVQALLGTRRGGCTGCSNAVCMQTLPCPPPLSLLRWDLAGEGSRQVGVPPSGGPQGPPLSAVHQGCPRAPPRPAAPQASRHARPARPSPPPGQPDPPAAREEPGIPDGLSPPLPASRCLSIHPCVPPTFSTLQMLLHLRSPASSRLPEHLLLGLSISSSSVPSVCLLFASYCLFPFLFYLFSASDCLSLPADDPRCYSGECLLVCSTFCYLLPVVCSLSSITGKSLLLFNPSLCPSLSPTSARKKKENTLFGFFVHTVSIMVGWGFF